MRKQQTVKEASIDKAKRHPSSLADQTTRKKPQRLGFMKGEIEVPDDFDRMDEESIAALFEQSSDSQTVRRRKRMP